MNTAFQKTDRGTAEFLRSWLACERLSVFVAPKSPHTFIIMSVRNSNIQRFS